VEVINDVAAWAWAGHTALALVIHDEFGPGRLPRSHTGRTVTWRVRAAALLDP
jgi:hypothetical protein